MSLSPFLFSLYIKDREDFLSENGFDPLLLDCNEQLNDYIKLFIVLYADDTAIIADNPANLQKGLDLLTQYCDQWKLKVNIEKTKVRYLRIGSRMRKIIASFKMEIE